MRDKFALLLFGMTNILNKKRTQFFLTLVWILALIQIPYFSYWFFSGIALFLTYYIDSMRYQIFSQKSLEFHWFEFIMGFNLFVVLGPIMIPIGIIHYLYTD